MSVKKGVVKKLVNILLEREEKRQESEWRKIEERFNKSFENLESLDDALISKYAVFEDNGDVYFKNEDISKNEIVR